MNLSKNFISACLLLGVMLFADGAMAQSEHRKCVNRCETEYKRCTDKPEICRQRLKDCLDNCP